MVLILAKRYALRKIAYEALKQSHTPKELFANLNKQGVVVEPVRNKQNKIYGIRFGYQGETFKASEVGRVFGLHSLFNHFGTPLERQNGTPFIPQHEKTTIHYTEQTTDTTSLIGGLFDMPFNPTPDEDPAEAEFRRRMQRKKKRGRRM